ncbi:uncharacterized protein [Triticum aestivum]|uniref:uncharacterized protein n=1 Tax=Triticum aestivum TaxID=4565 RepID=UPI001ABC8AA6|nr:uncharacterized protein LOC109747626 [Aegilops tauschii subsp. strangulata]XP_044439840.1 uncharacterized protein LOC123166135 [Triticum aestivum]
MMRAAGGAGAGVVPFLVRWLGRRMAWWPPVVPPAAPGDPLVSPCRWDGYCGAGGGVLVLDLASGFGRVVRVGQQPGMVVAPALGSGAGRSDAWTVSSWWRGRYTVARRLCSRRRPASSPASARLQANRFNLHFISSSSGRYSHMVLSQLRSTARLAPGAAGPNSSHTRTELVSRSGKQGGSMDASSGRPIGSRRWVAQGCERWDLSARLFRWGAAGLR